ncbi:Rnf electron transport complex subunit RnfD [Methanococcoides methylutens]|uniref:Electron transport complex protein RnfD n=1 Tax=Methanococcoides methylutens MM1 TaxID=1434104 RepID=A0A0E3STG4_METMT|nr:Rnf electron transport complex subunit RnfD [Methanococcoides methylutens]AKB85927.1 Electron transport complex protein RnfD [Methanococcoides methylutens MM1]
MTFTISAPPHRKEAITFKKMTWAKVIALMPVVLLSVYLFGLPAIGLVIASILAAVVTEVAIQKAFNQKITIDDGSTILIGLMVAMIIPPEAPLWIPMIGSVFAIGIGKHAFGGIGSYVFNPVLAAWVFLSLAWWSIMSPLSYPQTTALSDLILETGAGHIAGVSPLALLIPGCILILLRYVEWRIPVSFFLTTILLAVLVGDSLSYVVLGVVLFGILFLATDTSSSPVTKNGRVIYGIVCGVLVVVYGHFANYVDAIFYGLFLANCVSSLIDNNTLPESYGTETFLQRKYKRILSKVPFKDRLEVLLND